nr:MAG TPA: hypothetical protein [Caudoviricetes sp.]
MISRCHSWHITKNFAISAHRNPRFLISERRAYLWNNVRRLCTVK